MYPGLFASPLLLAAAAENLVRSPDKLFKYSNSLAFAELNSFAPPAAPQINVIPSSQPKLAESFLEGSEFPLSSVS